MIFYVWRNNDNILNLSLIWRKNSVIQSLSLSFRIKGTKPRNDTCSEILNNRKFTTVMFRTNITDRKSLSKFKFSKIGSILDIYLYFSVHSKPRWNLCTYLWNTMLILLFTVDFLFTSNSSNLSLFMQCVINLSLKVFKYVGLGIVPEILIRRPFVINFFPKNGTIFSPSLFFVSKKGSSC